MIELDTFILKDKLTKNDVKVLDLQSDVLCKDNGFKRLNDVYTCLYFLNTSSILNRRFMSSQTTKKELLKKTATLQSLSTENGFSRTKTEKNDLTSDELPQDIQETKKTKDRNTKVSGKPRRTSMLKRLAFKVKPVQRFDKTPEIKTSRIEWNSTRKGKVKVITKNNKSRHYSVISNKNQVKSAIEPKKRLSIKTFKPINHISRKITQQEQSMNLYNTPYVQRSEMLNQNIKKDKTKLINSKLMLRSVSLKKSQKSKLEPKRRKVTLNIYKKGF